MLPFPVTETWKLNHGRDATCLLVVGGKHWHSAYRKLNLGARGLWASCPSMPCWFLEKEKLKTSFPLPTPGLDGLSGHKS